MKKYLVENLVTKERTTIEATWDYTIGNLHQFFGMIGWYRVIQKMEETIK